MTQPHRSNFSPRLERAPLSRRRHALALACGLACAVSAHAIELQSDDPDTKIRLDFTPKYSTAYRLEKPLALLTSPSARGDGGVVNENAGDTNFKRGFIQNRLDLLTEFDYSRGNWGVRFSDAAWTDSRFLGNTDTNTAAGFARPEGSSVGRKNQLLDAFVYAKGSLGDMPGTIRIGKHSVQYGETLFFGQNGIAGAQSPVDIGRVVSVPNWQFKEVLLPVEQISGSLSLADNLTLGAYYQFKWRPSVIPGVGSYFSNQNYIGGGPVFFGPPLPPVLNTDNSKTQKPGNSGQFGMQLRWAPEGSAYEYGFYAARYHDKTPAVPVFDLINGNVHTTYGKGIETIGASVTSSIGQLNWALEGSLRHNAPLASDPAVLGGAPFMPASNCSGAASNPCFAVGNTAHLNLSGIYVLGKSDLWDGGALLGELAWNRTLSVKSNPSARGFGGLDPNTTRDAAALRMIFEPQYFQVRPGMDLSFPVGLGYNFGGRSSAVTNFAGGGSKVGDLSVGVKAKFQEGWNLSLNLTTYLGSANTLTVPDPQGTRMLSFGQSLKDRSYLAFSASRTF